MRIFILHYVRTHDSFLILQSIFLHIDTLYVLVVISYAFNFYWSLYKLFKNIDYSKPSHSWYQHSLQEFLYFMCFRHNIFMKTFAENF